MDWTREPASFRDPSGFVFVSDGVLYRQIDAKLGSHYRHLIESGLYGELVQDGLLISHEETDFRLAEAPPALAVIRPTRVPFISYPYEWCFSQYKAAAELTLEIQQRALARGMILRDASAYNVQFIGARPVFIDTLSFGVYEEGSPWRAYRQFCTHFLAPLALMASVDPDLGQLSRLHIDGVPLALATRLLPISTRLRPGLLLHLHLHARTQAKEHGRPAAQIRKGGMSKAAMAGMIESLARTVRTLSWNPPRTLWSTYSEHSNYTASAAAHKERLVAQWLRSVRSSTGSGMVWDLGANTGVYSQAAAGLGNSVVSFDLDHATVERHYRACSNRRESRVLPLVQDLTNPTSGTGWRNRERSSLEQRGPADVVLALAIIHHIALSGQVPLRDVAEFLATIGRHLIIEFVPPDDSQVQRMSRLWESFPDGYSKLQFEAEFEHAFKILDSKEITDTKRTLYLMARKS